MSRAVFRRSDRFELSMLGLLLLGWAFVVAPVVHQFEHGHRHSHGSSQSKQHGEGSLEHHHFALGSPQPLVEMPLLLLASVQVEPLAPRGPELTERRAEENAQGP